MSHPPFPAELLDHIIDHLHDARDVLKSCCLVSRSWVPRTRRYLFANVTFHDAKDLRSWKNTFPDPSASPACYTDHLAITCLEEVTSADAEEHGWITAFSRLVQLHLEFKGLEISLLPFHGFSPALKALHVECSHFPLSRILNLVHSFPLIEDLSLIMADSSYPIEDIDGQHAAAQPPLLRSLVVYARDGIGPIVSRIFPPQSGLHIRYLHLALTCEDDVFVLSALVERCRFTLESLKVHTGLYYQPSLVPIDLSKVIGLKAVTFGWARDFQWAIKALRTVTHDNINLQQLSFDAGWTSYGPNVGDDDLNELLSDIGEASYQEWLKLDSVLAQLWEAHSIRPEVTYNVPRGMRNVECRYCYRR